MENSSGGEIQSAGDLSRALCAVSALIDPAMDGEVLFKRLQFLIYELKEECASSVGPEARLDQLTHFFFEKKKFSCSSIELHWPSDSSHLISTLLTSRRARSDVLTSLFCLLAQEIGLALQILAVQPLRYVRLLASSSPCVLDLAEGGKVLGSQELIEVLEDQTPLDANRGRSYLDFTELLVLYLTHLRDCPSCPDELEIQLALQSQLILLCPRRMSLYGERAMILHQMGRKDQALKDLKRYFSFTDKETGSPTLVQLMARLESELSGSPFPEPAPL